MISPAALSLIVLLLCIILFITETFSMATTAVLGCVLMVLFNVADFNTVFGAFSSSTIILLVSIMIMGQAMFKNGVTQFIGRKLLKLSGGNERRLLFISTLLASLISAFMSNVATVTLFMGLFSNFSKENKKVNVRNLMLPIGMASVVGGATTLIGSAPQLTAQNYLISSDLQGFKFFDFSYVGIFLVILLVIYVMFIGYPIGMKIWSGLPESNTEEGFISINADKKRMTATVLIFVATVILMFWEPVPMAIIASSGALLTIMTKLITPKEAIQGIKWSSVLKVAGSIGILQAVNAAGGNKIMGQFFLNLIGRNISPYLFLLLIIFITQILSEFMADSPTILIVLPVTVSICLEYGFSVYPFAMAVILSSASACCSPLSNTPLMLVSTYGYRFSDFIKYNILWDILAALLIFLLTPVFFPLM